MMSCDIRSQNQFDLLNFQLVLKEYCLLVGLNYYEFFSHEALLSNSVSLTYEYNEVFDEKKYRDFVCAILDTIAPNSWRLEDNLENFDGPVIAFYSNGEVSIYNPLSARIKNNFYNEKNNCVGSSGPIFGVVFFKIPTALAQTNSVLQNVFSTIRENKGVYKDAIITTVLINIIAFATSLYSMHVYDTVIPTQSYYTLAILTFGVVMAIFFDYACKLIRSHLTAHVITEIDTNLSSSIFNRLLNVRLDQLPRSVGTLSAQVKSYESIRVFLSSTTIYIFVDAPFAIFFLIVVGLISKFLFTFILLIYLMISIACGVLVKRKTEMYARNTYNSSSHKSGLLVEVIDGAETIKSSGNTTNILKKWITLSSASIRDEINIREVTEKLTLIASFFNQLSYITIVCLGSFFVAEGDLSMGALVATTILTGRILSPVASIPGILSQYSTVKASLAGIEELYNLEQDNFGIKSPLSPNKVFGSYTLKNIDFSYSNISALKIDHLIIPAGQKLGIIGPIGSGKSTLLKLLSGHYKPQSGTVLLDDLDILHYNKKVLAKNVGYLQQEHRLFNGTLRENLLLGIPSPGDDKIRDVCTKTGLIKVIADNPLGLEMVISEGGRGLSGGQKQLLAFTRILLSNPQVWLLDEPTASMDGILESNIINILNDEVVNGKTVIVVTHKLNILSGFSRILFVNNHKILLDGEKDWVFKKLGQMTSNAQ